MPTSFSGTTLLNANDFFLNRGGLARPETNQNIFGGSLGGPVVKEKFGYFFLNYQGTRQRSGDSPGTIISTNIPLLPADRSVANLESAFNLPSIDPVLANAGGTGLLQLAGCDGTIRVEVRFLHSRPEQVAANCTVGCTPGLTNGTVNTGSFTVSKPGKYNDDQFTSNWDREFRKRPGQNLGALFSSRIPRACFHLAEEICRNRWAARWRAASAPRR